MQVLAPKAIVVVDDHRPSLDLVAESLERDGYSVIPCADMARAHAVIRAAMPDLVMLDSRGAGATNWHASAMLKLDAQTAAIPVLLCLGDDADHVAVSARAGAMGCGILVAPFEPDDLLRRVRDLLG